MTLLRHLTLAAAAVLILGGIAPARADAAAKSIWGPLQFEKDGNYSSAFPTYKRLGVDVLQRTMSWRNVAASRPANPRNPADPAYSWPSEVDYALREGRRTGVKLMLLVAHTPAWANGGRDQNWAPTRARDYADFMYAASRRYRRVTHWMVWGEPSRQTQFQPMPQNSKKGPRRYARLLDMAYGALKKANRRDIVIGGNTFTVGDVHPANFVRWMRLPNGKPPRLDWYGHNPFSTRFPDLRDRPQCSTCRDFGDIDTYIREIRRAYRKRNRRPKLWLSEFTIQSDHASDQFQFYTSREGQAAFLKAGFRIARRHKYVAGLGWYQLMDDPGPPGGVSRNWGLMTTSRKKKPAYSAYQRARG